MSEELDRLLHEAEELDPHARELTRRLAAELLRIHGEGLSELMSLLSATPNGKTVLDELVGAEKVKGLLLLHGLHPRSLEARAREALARQGTDLRRRGVSVELLGVSDAVIELRATRTHGSEKELADVIEDLLVHEAPDAERIDIVWELRDIAAPEQLIPLTSLRKKIVEPPSRVSEADACELCGVALAPSHEHLFEDGRRELRCACTACALLFDAERSSNGGKMARKRIAQRAERLVDCTLSDAEWSALAVPVSMAFFVSRGPNKNVTSFYPGAAGVVESAVAPELWTDLLVAHPRLSRSLPEVEALFVVRSGALRGSYLFSIDVCFLIAGHMRHHWQGLTGGKRVWDELRGLFDRLNLRQGDLHA